tara:strand:- start:7551 stop:8537 length:987 start_codon:yes stop_codon:yes gene_type:complete
MHQEAKEEFSIVIPVIEGSDDIEALLKCLENQTHIPSEIIIVESKTKDSDFSKEIIDRFTHLPIKYILSSRMMPGEARNVGIKTASKKWVAFLDIRTFPPENWLESINKIIKTSDFKFIKALIKCRSNSRFQNLLKYSSYGNNIFEGLPGSAIRRNSLSQKYEFIGDVRAGEDIEWINKIENDFSFGVNNQSIIIYEGLPKTLITAAKKWYLYAFANSKLKFARLQEITYFFVLIFLLIFAYNWNFFATGGQWNQSPYFIPHLNKILWIILFLIYFFFRAFYLPKNRGVSKKELLPLNWIGVGFIGMLIDLIKAPGRLLGVFYIRKKK